MKTGSIDKGTFCDLIHGLELLNSEDYEDSLAHASTWPRKIISCSSRASDGDILVIMSTSSGIRPEWLRDAKNRGVSLIISNLGNLNSIREYSYSLPWLCVEDPSHLLSKLVIASHREVFESLDFIGITGTNGKTSSSWILSHALNSLGKTAAFVGTKGAYLNGKFIRKGATWRYTTPPIDILAEIALEIYSLGGSIIVMEVSSHGIDQKRIEGICWRSLGFTNLSQDHLDYHKTMEAYANTKLKLFVDHPAPNTALCINIDDEYGKYISRNIGKFHPLYLCSLAQDEESNLRAEILQTSLKGSSFLLRQKSGKKVKFFSQLAGEWNISNALISIALLCSLGFELDQLPFAIESVPPIPGRLERVKWNLPVFIDYAHTPDALANVLEGLRIYVKGKIILVFGCGGDRDKKKRPLMGSIAERLADYIILTSDNPRTEDPEQIIADIIEPISKEILVEVDRKKAIGRAFEIARKDDCILIAGKGHESYQEIGTERYDFSDRQVCLELIEELSLKEHHKNSHIV